MENNTNSYTKTFSIDVERANYHLKCRQRRIKRTILIVLMWVLILTYFFSPLSKVNLKANGNVYYSEEDLMSMTYIKKSDYWWLINSKKAKKVLESYEYIDSAKISKSFTGLKIEINEIYPLGIKNEKYVMNNKQIISKESYDLNDKVTTLTNFNNIKEEDMDNFIDRYSKIHIEVRNHFNDIEIIDSKLSDSNIYKYVKIYGSDERIGNFIIKVDLVYLNTKFNGNKYDKIIEEVSKNNVKYIESNPALIAYHYIDEEEFHLVEIFEEE